MTGVFFFWLWVGGIEAAYLIERRGGAPRVVAAGLAMMWPIGVALCIAMRFYISESEIRNADPS